MLERPNKKRDHADRRHFIGGSDARIIMGQDEKALTRLWQEKRGEVGPEDLSTNLIVQLGLVTEGPQSPIRLLLTWLPLDSLAYPDSGPASVLFDELDPGSLKSRLYLVSGVGSAA